MDSGGGTVEDPDPNAVPIPPETTTGCWTDRVYIYGPGYVDEFVCQIDRWGNGLYMLQDGNFNVVALAYAGGPDGYDPGTMMAQYSYEPYGQLVTSESFYSHADNRVGFQGLFFERLDSSLGVDLGAASSNADGLYYARNRFYNPIFGRFMQRDPRDTALLFDLGQYAREDQEQKANNIFDPLRLYADGLDLYLFVCSNPVNLNDPSGLFSSGDLAFMAGSFLGSADAAQHLDGRTNYMYYLAKFAIGQGVKYGAQKAIEKSEAKKLLWEVWNESTSASSVCLKELVCFLGGYDYGATIYTIWTACEGLLQ
jgi:hypothetical protein